MKVFRFGFAAAVLAAFVVVHQARPAQAEFTEKEAKCSAAVAKGYAKLQTTILKLQAKCHADDISGKKDDPNGCDPLPADAAEKVTKAKAKFVSTVAKACKSVCSISTDVACVSDLTCPARHSATPPNNAAAEKCLGKDGKAPFSLLNLDWPGPYCDSILGHAMTSPSDLGTCLAALVDSTAGAIDQAVYADLDETPAIGADTRKCVSSIDKAVQRAAGRAYLATASCRDTRRSINLGNNPPFACGAGDPDTVADIQKEIDKLNGSIAKACTDTDIAALPGLCAAGGTVPATVAEAQACITAMVREVATGEPGLERHVYSPVTMLNATHPDSAAAYCGDGIVTARREEHTGVGEECDGDADAACGAGSCLPPGDIFECTCDTTPRERFVVNGDAPGTDSDAGWIGASHDATHNNGFGYVTEFSDCDCSAFTQATCTGTSGDSVCDVYGNRAPRCSDDLSNGSQTCDQRGNGNGIPENSDCFRCDDNSINAGTYCANVLAANETVCQSQCFVNDTGLAVVPVTPCQAQEDCGDGQTCRGRCDNTLTCNTLTEGSPLPLISAANPVCVMLEYKTDIVGTKNIVTGEQAVDYTTRSSISLGAIFSQPCPVCGGVCMGGGNDGDTCAGRCEVATTETCLLDADCPGPGEACLQSAADCTGGFCSLDLRCSDGLHQGELCRPDATTTLGTVSHDCPPVPNNAISGAGLSQPFGNVTTEAVQFPAGAPCTDPSWHNYDCPCPADVGMTVGLPTKPSSCAATCDGGINVGKGCVTGGGGSGIYTVCVGGPDNGVPCDADTDCEVSNDCSGNPQQCTAGSTAQLGLTCAVNSDCGGGGLCEDPCPGARCVPLCYQEGKCNGGARDGDPCSTLDHCKQCTAGNPNLIGTGCDVNARCNTTAVSGDGVCEAILGVTCDITDPEDGVCANGPVKYRCTGPGFTTIPCTLEYGTCDSGHCSRGSASLRGAVCTLGTDCVENENVPVSSGCETGIDSIPGNSDDIPGAGECETRPEDCFVNNGFAEGGDTLNGQGSPSDVKVNADFCVPPNSNPAVNGASGFGGPSRIRREGSAFVNVTSIP